MSRQSFRFLLLLALVLGPTSRLTQADDFPPVDDFKSFTKKLQKIANSKSVILTSLAKSPGQRDVWMLTLGNHAKKSKPAILLLGSVEGDDLVGSTLAMGMVEKLLEKPNNAKTPTLLSNMTVYVIPRPNPDAYERFFSKPLFSTAHNNQPIDDDRDGKTDEDPPNDLDKNNIITMMRVQDPTGEWMPHPDDDRLLIKADTKKGEQGKYKLYVEGIDDDKDDKWNEDPKGGVDFNQNFTFAYPYFGQGAGPHQVSEPETRAVVDFTFDHPEIALVYSFSKQDNLITPWKPNPQAEKARIKTTVIGSDAPFYNTLSADFKKSYKPLGPVPKVPSASNKGSLSSWAYFHLGRWSLSTPAWIIPEVKKDDAKKEDVKDGDPKKDEPKKSKDSKPTPELTRLRWLEDQKIDGFVDWKKIDHPDFPGKLVEVGGFKPYAGLQPTKKTLEKLITLHTNFLTASATKLPKLEINQTKVTGLGEGLVRVTVRVLNTGAMPTMPKMGEINREGFPLNYLLTVPKGTTFITGHARGQLSPLGPKAGPAGSKEIQWLIRLPEKQKLDDVKFQFRFWSPCVGQAEETFGSTS